MQVPGKKVNVMEKGPIIIQKIALPPVTGKMMIT